MLCPECNGTRGYNTEYRCSECNGTGKVTTKQWIGTESNARCVTTEDICKKCGGTRAKTIVWTNCGTCAGAGTVIAKAFESTCPMCKGQRTVILSSTRQEITCPECKGKGSRTEYVYSPDYS